MIKKLSIFLIAVLMVVSASAQPAERSGSALFAPRAGQFQVSIVLGDGLFYPESITGDLLPSYFPSADLDGNRAVSKLHLGSLNNNSIVNIAGLQTKYFITNHLEINAMFSMDISLTPDRDYVEGIDMSDLLTTDTDPSKPIKELTNFLSSEDLDLGGFAYMEGKLTNAYMVNLGTNYYFNNCNGRIFPYLGIAGGFQHNRIQTYLPYTGMEVEIINPEITGGQSSTVEPIELYLSDTRAGEAYSISGAVVAGVEYNFLPGFNVAFEVRPFNYYYSVARIYSEGLEWNGDTHQFKFFAFPQLKFGIRF